MFTLVSSRSKDCMDNQINENCVLRPGKSHENIEKLSVSQRILVSSCILVLHASRNFSSAQFVNIENLNLQAE